jgi:enoyl-CoA hydratase/carnithine racemase|tara:strand:+ start:139 stop:603 length:465 start_codon:yes stop_codon:yes gene_type:complete
MALCGVYWPAKSLIQVIASENAIFGQPEVKFGIMTGWGGSQRLSRSIGKNRTMELLMTGRSFSAREALSMGLVTQVVPPAALMDTGLDAARRLVALPANALKLTKKVVLRGQDMEIYQACEMESQAFALCFADGNKNEGVNAFLEKRKPQFNAE